MRTWTDRSKSFSVDAQFLGVRDGKLNLHKMNGVKIAVPIAKMSVEDLEYVERLTGLSFDEDKPLSDLKKKSAEARRAESSRVGASVEQPKKPDYDWFQFFLSCDVAVGLCERYAQAFSRDSMDESVLPDVDASILRNLGLKEGDIIKVMRYLDNRYARTKKSGDENEGGLFSGPGGLSETTRGKDDRLHPSRRITRSSWMRSRRRTMRQPTRKRPRQLPAPLPRLPRRRSRSPRADLKTMPGTLSPPRHGLQNRNRPLEPLNPLPRPRLP